MQEERCDKVEQLHATSVWSQVVEEEREQGATSRIENKPSTFFKMTEPSSLTSAGRVVPELTAETEAALKRIDGEHYNHPGYRHFFWEHMAKGDYDLDFLRKYALHYYEHVRVFRLYLAGAMTVVPVEEFQVILSEIIADEFGVRLYGEPDVDGHPELFRRFMRSLGLTEADC